MKQIINLLLEGRKLMFSEGTEGIIRAVSDNDSYYLKLEGNEELPTAVFARIRKDGNLFVDVLLDENRMCNIPMGMLENGDLEVGFYSEGFATTTLRIRVQSSVVRKEGIEDDVSVPSQTEQLIALVNSIPIVNGAFVNEKGELVLNMLNSADYNAGSVIGPEGDKGDRGEKGDKGEKGNQGEKGDRGEKGDAYIITEADKEEIALIALSAIDSELYELIGTGVTE